MCTECARQLMCTAQCDTGTVPVKVSKLVERVNGWWSASLLRSKGCSCMSGCCVNYPNRTSGTSDVVTLSLCLTCKGYTDTQTIRGLTSEGMLGQRLYRDYVMQGRRERGRVPVKTFFRVSPSWGGRAKKTSIN